MTVNTGVIYEVSNATYMNDKITLRKLVSTFMIECKYKKSIADDLYGE
jgi:hypothetical protein